MKAKCISNKRSKYPITINKSYVIFAGKCDRGNNGAILISSIFIQDDSGSIGIYDSNNFQIENISFDLYIFSSINQGEFCFDSISYDNFWSIFYNDSQEVIEGYLKAKQDFKFAKMILYRDYSLEELYERIMNDCLDERDFIFEFLRNERNDSFINLAIDIIKEGIEKNVKYFEVDEIFKYLTSFKHKSIEEFFIEYMSDDNWGNEEINMIVYSYF